MKLFFKIFFASLTALVIFSVILFFIALGILRSATSPDKPDLGSNGILVLDLSTMFNEQAKNNPLAFLSGDAASNAPGLYDVVRMIHYAKTDSTIKGLYIKADYNSNGYASSEELVQAVNDFKESKKFVIAYGENLTQKSYYVAATADKVYCHPKGMLEWDGFSVNLLFMKDLLDRLEIQPQIFYAGKFKSATEPFRANQMTEPNRLQTSVFLNDLYGTLLSQTARSRNLDTAELRSLAVNGSIRSSYDALKYHLIDGVKYDDEVKQELFRLTKQKEKEKLNLISFGKYDKAVDYKDVNGKDKIAVLYASGEIVDGKGKEEQIGSDDFRDLLRKLRMDDEVKAIVFRVNSPGGSALASDVIWREISLAKKVKPVVVSMGDYAASGGYYISCAADSIYADPGTLTGSIGVFTMIPNMQSFFKNKLGISFDGVKTGPYADMGSITRPLTNGEETMLQNDIDSVYYTFKSRVANGRNKSVDYIDSIAQGRVWTGERAIDIGLVDKTGTLNDAIACAARMAKTKDYRTREYPEQKSLLEQLLGDSYSKTIKANAIKEEIGEHQYNILQKVQKLKGLFGITQARLPFDFDFH